jgi:hypothetical protein
VARLSFTFKEPSSAVGIARSATCILAAGEGFYADAVTAESGLGRIFEANGNGVNNQKTFTGPLGPIQVSVNIGDSQSTIGLLTGY